MIEVTMVRLLNFLADQCGFTFNDSVRFFALKRNAIDLKYVDYAKRNMVEEGMLEIDDKAYVSRTTDTDSDGAYVQAWVWVSKENIE